VASLVILVAVAAGALLAAWGLRRWRARRWGPARAASAVLRVRIEDALKHLYESELHAAAPTIQSVAGAVRLSLDEAAEVLHRLQERRLIEIQAAGIRLTPSGRELGLHVLRAHRLLESYLADHTGFPAPDWHGRAHVLEHDLSPDDVAALSARLQHPTHDPHGDPIPAPDGAIVGRTGVPLTAAPPDRALRILHLEDEPRAVYAQLVAMGLDADMPLRLLEASPDRVRVAVGGAVHVLAPLVARSVTVAVLPTGSRPDAPPGEPLSSLRPGDEGRVLSVSRRCRGPERRRLMDLGVLPGTVIRAEMHSPSGDPTAYRVRGALIALRAEQAALISVERLTQPEAAAA
jgi:DtxR family Mn-dependent transcriptional regulator